MFHSIKKAAAGVLVLAALGLGGSALANAASSSSAATAVHHRASAQPSGRMPAPGTAAHEDAERTVTGEAATRAQAAAVKSVGGGTAGAVTTDCLGHGYEVVVTRADGTKVEVHLDSSFNVIPGPGLAGRSAPGPGSGAPGSPGAPPAINR
jgi:membrane protein implicated in regulation of membrane protease activity